MFPFGGQKRRHLLDTQFELDGKIERYERIAASIFDQLTIDRIKELVEQTKA
jgi:hypothetical protein